MLRKEQDKLAFQGMDPAAEPLRLLRLAGLSNLDEATMLGAFLETAAILKKDPTAMERSHNHGREAIDLWKRGSYDLVLMDVQMPQMDGLEATKTLRSLEREKSGHTPIIAMTANAMKGDRERCLEAGMDDYLSKPVKAQHLNEIIERYLLRAKN